MGAAITVLGKKDGVVKELTEYYKEGEVIRMCTMQKNACLDLICKDGRMRVAKPWMAKKTALKIEFKNMQTLFEICMAKKSLHEAFCEHRMTMSGDISGAMSVMRAVYFVEATLFPWFMAKKVLKRRIKGAAKIPTYCKLIFVRKVKEV